MYCTTVFKKNLLSWYSILSVLSYTVLYSIAKGTGIREHSVPVLPKLLFIYSKIGTVYTLVLLLIFFPAFASVPTCFFLTYDLFLFVEADFERDGVTRWGNSICLNRRLWTLFTLKNRPLQSFRCPELRVHRYKIRDLRFSYNYNSSTLRSYLNLDTVS
jgi:hypothetical protein